VGEIKSHWLGAEKKFEIVSSVEMAKDKGITVTRTCRMWIISRRRVNRWRSKFSRGESLANGKPGPANPLHKLLPDERQAVLQMAKAERYMDLSHRILAVTAWEQELFFVSFSSVYRILKSENLMSMRGKHRHHNGRSLPPVRKELTGPNQRWCWDISYLLTYEKGLFLYLFLLLDEYSRKAINWLVSWRQTSQEAKELLEGGLILQDIIDLPEDQRPEIVNDRGRQMKAKPVKKMFEDHKMPQLFARPRTPNDNPFIESAFSTVKSAPVYPGRFLDCDEASRYFNGFFPWYNTEHYHSGIDYVTPDQCHLGLREKIVSDRKTKLTNQQKVRKEVNRQELILTDISALVYDDLINPTTCSVIPP
jgi:putative transposase